MTAPRQILPRTSYLVTRRCSERRFFLRPSTVTNAIFLYVLAIAARLYRIDVHAFCVLSNHYHLLVTDREGRLPAFMQYLDSLVARAVNASLGRWEGFWSSESSYSAVSHGERDDLARKAAYVIANPVSAGLVRNGHEWPGLWTAPRHLGTATLVAPRPKAFFSSEGRMPEVTELVLTTPAGFESAAEFQACVEAAVVELEEEKRRQLGRDGFVGAKGVLAQSPFARPAGREPRRGLNPRIAGRDKWKRIEAITRLRDFICEYRSAWKQWRAGVRDVLFPAGTYQLRLEHRVRCAAVT